MGAMTRLGELGLTLPEVPTPGGAYVPYVHEGDLVYTSGQLPMVEGSIAATGKLGAEVTTERGAELATICALNILAIGNEVAPDLDGLRVVKVTVFVASDPSFTEQAKVANGASELFSAVLGDAGQHARSAVGMAALPRDSPVEVEALLSLG